MIFENCFSRRQCRILIAFLALLQVGTRASAQMPSGGNPPASGAHGTTSTLPTTPNQAASSPVHQPVSVVPSASGPSVCTTHIPTAPIPPSYVALTVPVAKCTQPPKIDGNLEDPCWKTATHIAGFYPYSTLLPIKSADQTEAWICADATHLYVAFHCAQTSPVVASQTQRNGDLSKDDFAGFDVDSQNRKRTFSTFLVNPAGIQEEFLEGGTATNITWAGDWTAAGKRTSDGYIIEMAVPFALLKYPKGSHNFGILLYRQISGRFGLQSWPYTPMNGTSGDVEGQYMAEITGMALPYFAPRPTFLPYTLMTTGAGNSVRNGLDIKYPLSTTLTGVASFYPDLDTIEQSVESIQFSYNQKLLTDNRPFFAEGSNFLPDNDLFYSRTIGQFDQGIKLVGKDGDTSIGALATNYDGSSSQSESAINVRQDFGPHKDVGVEFVDDQMTGQPSNQVGRIYTGYSWNVPHDQYSLIAAHAQSYQGGAKADGSDSITFQNAQGQVNQPYFVVQYVDIGPNFVSSLGYVPELDKRGTSLVYGENETYTKGPIAVTNFEIDADQYQHHTGGFFHTDGSLTLYAQTKSGYTLAFVPEADQRIDFHDHTDTIQFQSGKNTLYQQGTLADTFGKEEGQNYNYLSYSQGIFATRLISIQLTYARETLGDSTSTQTILTNTYRLNATQTIGCRIVNQFGATNVFLSFSQEVRTGTDIFILFGNPNAESTIGSFTLKLEHPF
jgi:hypothetical protein